MPSPQRGGVQFVRHVAFAVFEFAAPRSHSSPNALSMIVSPHLRVWQFVRHVAFGLLLLLAPASHCSPAAMSRMPLPQVSADLQSPEQPSPETLLPSSQTSPVSLMPSPQRGFWQLLRHLSGRSAFETSLSHCSPCI